MGLAFWHAFLDVSNVWRRRKCGGANARRKIIFHLLLSCRSWHTSHTLQMFLDHFVSSLPRICLKIIGPWKTGVLKWVYVIIRHVVCRWLSILESPIEASRRIGMFSYLLPRISRRRRIFCRFREKFILVVLIVCLSRRITDWRARSAGGVIMYFWPCFLPGAAMLF